MLVTLYETTQHHIPALTTPHMWYKLIYSKHRSNLSKTKNVQNILSPVFMDIRTCILSFFNTSLQLIQQTHLTYTVKLRSCAYLDVVLSYEVRLPFLQDLEEYFHEVIQKCWVLWRFYYHLQVTINDIQCDVKWTLTNTQKQAT